MRITQKLAINIFLFFNTDFSYCLRHKIGQSVEPHISVSNTKKIAASVRLAAIYHLIWFKCSKILITWQLAFRAFHLTSCNQCTAWRLGAPQGALSQFLRRILRNSRIHLRQYYAMFHQFF